MKNLLLITLTICSITSFAQESINWMSWSEAQEVRKTQPKKIFIDVYTDWCGWCKKMDASTFKDPQVAAYMNKNYYCVKLNAERKDTIMYDGHAFINPNPTGKRATHTLAASLLDNRLSYPSYVMFDENMNRIHVIPGFKQVEPFLGIAMFFGSNQHVTYNQYFSQQQQRLQQQAPQN